MLADVEFGCEGPDGRGGSTTALSIVVIEQSKECGKVVVRKAWKKRHCAEDLLRRFDLYCSFLRDRRDEFSGCCNVIE